MAYVFQPALILFFVSIIAALLRSIRYSCQFELLAICEYIGRVLIEFGQYKLEIMLHIMIIFKMDQFVLDFYKEKWVIQKEISMIGNQFHHFTHTMCWYEIVP